MLRPAMRMYTLGLLLGLSACLSLSACNKKTEEPTEATPEKAKPAEPAKVASSAAATPPSPPSAAPASDPKAIPAPADVAAPPADAKKTASGLATKILTPGKGTQHPKDDDKVKVHYTGWTSDGKMFDSSVARGEP